MSDHHQSLFGNVLKPEYAQNQSDFYL